ncbi:4-carboxy-4-hydroxy-2-oxoadipate aldolase/oxaloacetate decarboxylase [uncultured Acinetobacter sp.]|uniref:4-carboxy-4-hydroxy-2-oxoadipate aldolase/oxaloacetate decarboxylase n=1 Tax=uncultured Acinetobacter sp. TaxID=165433 RepID=UPI00258ADD89|nr:4-carboxy-4-hydroxy-2-oxoadipate aldolase/oxaloacetate decarboxylase [uncultured Acinetobacter sp.]
MNILGHKGVVVRQIDRIDQQVIKSMAQYGVATIHEAQGRKGLMAPRIRPIQQGVCISGSAVTLLVAPGDNWMFHVAVEQCLPGDIIVVSPTSPCYDGFFGDLLATSMQARGVVGLVGDIGIRDSQVLRKMGFHVWSRAIYSQGTVKETLGSVNVPIVCADQLVNPGDMIVADDDGVVVIRREEALDVEKKSQQRMHLEESKRQRMALGELGLDIYEMRLRLAEKGLRYVERLEDLEL